MAKSDYQYTLSLLRLQIVYIHMEKANKISNPLPSVHAIYMLIKPLISGVFLSLKTPLIHK